VSASPQLTRRDCIALRALGDLFKGSKWGSLGRDDLEPGLEVLEGECVLGRLSPRELDRAFPREQECLRLGGLILGGEQVLR
jgi:hypothetical protein